MVIDADQPAGVVDHRRRDQVLLAEDVGHLLLVHRGGHGDDLRIHDLGHVRRPLGAQHPAERHGADRTVARVDHEDVVEILRQPLALAHVVDGLADGPEHRHGDEVALHQPAGGILREGEVLLDHAAQRLGDGLQHLALQRLVQPVEHVERVIGIDAGDGARHGAGADLGHHLVAHGIVELGQDVGVEARPDALDQPGAPLGRELLQKVGQLGIMEPGDQRVSGRVVAGVERRRDGAHHLRPEPQQVAGLGRGLDGLGSRLGRIVDHRPSGHERQDTENLGPLCGGPEGWCGREDSNFHGVSPTATSTLRVYQFRHDRAFEDVRISCETQGLGIPNRLMGRKPLHAPGATETVEWRTAPGLVPYDEAVRAMEERVAAIRAGTARELVWLVEHPPLYTAGTSASDADLLDAARFPVHRTGRGGQYTYHGPGQRVAYVMLDLEARGRDVRAFVTALEEWLIRALARLGVAGERRPGRVGIWVARPGREDKIAAIGVRVRRWVSYHGVALNVNPELGHYAGIVPCGIAQHGVTSLADLGRPATMDDADAALRAAFAEVFEN